MAKRGRESFSSDLRDAEAQKRRIEDLASVAFEGLRSSLRLLDYADLIRVRRTSRACLAAVDLEVTERSERMEALVRAGSPVYQDSGSMDGDAPSQDAVRVYGRLLRFDVATVLRVAWASGNSALIVELARIGRALRPESVAHMLNHAAASTPLGDVAPILIRLATTAKAAGLRLDDLFDSGQNALHVAIRCASCLTAKTLLRDYGMDPDRPDSENSTPLEIAVLVATNCHAKCDRRHGDAVSIVQALLDERANPNVGRPLMLALQAESLTTRAELSTRIIPLADVRRHADCFTVAAENCPMVLPALIERGAAPSAIPGIVFPWMTGFTYGRIDTFETYSNGLDVEKASDEFARKMMIEAAHGARHGLDENARNEWMSAFIDLTCRVDHGLLGRKAYALCKANPGVMEYLIWHRPDVLSLIALKASAMDYLRPREPLKLAVVLELMRLAPNVDFSSMSRRAKFSLSIAFGRLGGSAIAIARVFPESERECPHAALRYALAIQDDDNVDRALRAGASQTSKDGFGNDAIGYAARWLPTALPKLQKRRIFPLIDFDVWCTAH